MHAILELAEKKTVIFDGAMGTMLIAAGLKAGDSPELWNIEKPAVIMDIHRKYYEAGSDVVHTNTFGGNAIKLEDKGLRDSWGPEIYRILLNSKQPAASGKWTYGFAPA